MISWVWEPLIREFHSCQEFKTFKTALPQRLAFKDIWERQCLTERANQSKSEQKVERMWGNWTPMSNLSNQTLHKSSYPSALEYPLRSFVSLSLSVQDKGEQENSCLLPSWQLPFLYPHPLPPSSLFIEMCVPVPFLSKKKTIITRCCNG